MLSQPFRQFPNDFDELIAALPAGLSVRSSVLEPTLIVSRIGHQYVVSLGSYSVSLSAESNFFAAPSLSSNWVIHGSTIHPLPIDCPEIVSSALSGLDPENLSFPEVLSLYASRIADLKVVLDESTMTSANNLAESHLDVNQIDGLRATLYPYQAQGVSWLRSTITALGGAILADEMGLGKTIQVISLLLLVRPSASAPALILCPTTLIANWIREINVFAPSLTVRVHRGSTRGNLPRDLLGADIVLTTYDTAVNDLVLFRAVDWSWLICDEAQALKNPDSQRRTAVSQIPRRYMLPVTGTPMEIRLLDLWSLMDLAIPNLLGPRKDFESTFLETRDHAWKLGDLVAPLMLRRRVSEVAGDLPERTDVAVPLELTDELAYSYERIRRDVLEEYAAAGALVATGKLQMFCADPILLEGHRAAPRESQSNADAQQLPRGITPKLETAADLIRSAVANQRKVLVFCNYNALGAILRQEVGLTPDGYWNAINGATPQADRQTIVDTFAAHQGPSVLVLNPRAAGAGLNITAATVVIHFTQVWNPALEAQASARAHRRGQKLPVTVYHLYYVSTVEELMLERAQHRRELGEGAVQDSESLVHDMTRALFISPISK